MSAPRTSFLHPDSADRHGPSSPGSSSMSANNDGNDPYAPKPTYATFSPVAALSGASTASSAAKRRSVILVHQKSPLLLATPPQITRALAYSHPYLLPLNKLAGLLSWTTGDAWESFVMVLVWWGLVLYGDSVIRAAGPILLVLTLIAGIYFFFGYGAGGANGTASKTGRDAASTKSRSRAKNQSIDSSGASTKSASKGSHSGSLAPANASGHQRNVSEVVTHTRHQKTLDEIVGTLKEFTARCNLLLEPLLELTDFLSTQSTPISATTRPALTVLFVRILLCTPIWFSLTLPPLRIITTRRTILVFGTVILTWHSQAMRVSRTILWRSATVRRGAALVTGLEFDAPVKATKAPSYVTAGGPDALAESGATPAAAAAAVQSKLSSTRRPRGPSTPRESELTKAIRRARAGHDAGVRFTFILYENQRRWVGLGWTTSLFTYERPSWTDEHNNAVPSKDDFELPEVEDGSKMCWRWVEGSRWRVDGVVDDAVRIEKTGAFGEHTDTWDYDGDGGRMGWVYYDNKWQNGRRGQDSWNRWTRRRKWYRDAELVEVDAEDSLTPDSEANMSTPTLSSQQSTPQARGSSPAPSHSGIATAWMGANGTLEKRKSGDSSGDHDEVDTDAISLMSTSSRSGRKRPSLRRRVTDASVRGSAAPTVTTTATAMAMSTNARRDGDGMGEEDAAMLSSSAGVKLHEPRVGSWGIGDEAQMSLE
ncbi:integral peroxisomal membrane protein [Grosmannia clavigera kw1407]|uniref:Integral peroxisomal membrane protein n=1 Tax=Grosmannia clavigera (strain kw1407 / UAMH 11150) TaxID=655863 RepID=F0XJW9_GROCL|nr:integral peroxisomal membrane protein [Grosmannia clavigera kw1407]EFX02059.1 integral peroxisomal membrane protein [Grosmannia clavigera kw1407]